MYLHKMKSSTLLPRVAILYQCGLPPIKDGMQKPMKPGGYSDSGADIAFQLIKNKILVITSNPNPKVNNDFDWVFPDTAQGILSALDKGANIFWLNTLLYQGHPIEKFYGENIEFVGQLPKETDIYDDKWVTNNVLRDNGLSVPKASLITKDKQYNYLENLQYPLVMKPLRGRGSQGVIRIEKETELQPKLGKLFSEGKYGNALYLEKFLVGQEITITVMPPGKYEINKEIKNMNKPWSLPAVKRFNHINGVAPYNWIVAVRENSCVLEDDELKTKAIIEIYQQCEKAATIVNSKAPIRIDGRADENGKYWIFDLNMKPNLTGASRPHRQNQDCLSVIAGQKIGWSYGDYLVNMFQQRWHVSANEES